jgi:hypothetical protein
MNLKKRKLGDSVAPFCNESVCVTYKHIFVLDIFFMKDGTSALNGNQAWVAMERLRVFNAHHRELFMV